MFTRLCTKPTSLLDVWSVKRAVKLYKKKGKRAFIHFREVRDGT